MKQMVFLQGLRGGEVSVPSAFSGGRAMKGAGYDAKGKRLRPQPSQNYTDRLRLRHCLKGEVA
ncbi:hypothetical protein [Thalassospira indica]|uniref:hypothetical protein n=1 Tax=Thalassospira indica TaxID=1891279 RepID=UPI0007FCDF58|nr:hypothetical protein [Thalassospira indica]OAZ11356.1 hypothetical protein TH15_17955 [Thalassospira profundimaris]